jgi:CBS domain containing-hemolysin-like protein
MIAMTDTAAWIFWPVFCAVNIVMAGFFAGMETGIYLLNNLRMELHAETGSRQASMLRRMLAKPNRLLAVLLTGTNIHHYMVTFSISMMFAMASFGENAKWYTMAAATPVLFILADSVPKHIFRRRTEGLVYGGIGLLWLAHVIFHVTGLALLVRLASEGIMAFTRREPGGKSRLSRPELTVIVEEGHASGALTLAQANMVDRVISIRSVKLSDVMTPMKQAVCAPIDETREAFIRRIAHHDYSRLPLVDPKGRAMGIVNIYDVLADEKQLAPADLCSEPLLLDSTTGITAALLTMRRSRNAMAIVFAPGGKHIGLVTIKDLVEEITGELDAW